MAENDRNRCIEEYFHIGFSYQEIIDCLFLNNEIRLIINKRVLAKQNLGRRRFRSLYEIVDPLEVELKGSIVGNNTMVNCVAGISG